MCRHCKQAVENQEHIVNCYTVHGDEEWLSLNQYHKSDSNHDVESLKEVLHRIEQFHEYESEQQQQNDTNHQP